MSKFEAYSDSILAYKTTEITQEGFFSRSHGQLLPYGQFKYRVIPDRLLSLYGSRLLVKPTVFPNRKFTPVIRLDNSGRIYKPVYVVSIKSCDINSFSYALFNFRITYDQYSDEQEIHSLREKISI